ncbi:hypothetical protein GCM10010329_64430 [Streptomyces spiroverticillatus]|uniref:Uncharacterized protein n=1 Tax=Streptomyces finlayi TaxID=67296 RepID=A0A918X4E4_9ACTN|nr:hypothetical protein [Streptomyces finlayi]GHA32208.1 hypothetical protein GCM10010329_64430 [Streptomyces spiroverticillatus]GHD10704.1 hypothetical protein GCM10010334_66120 [Streptomyces finlayi]
MIVALVVACEVAFWVLLLAGLALRYLAKMPRLGTAVLLCEPLLEVVLLVVTVLDLRNGARPDWKHGLAAVYIGFTVVMAHRTLRWLDVRFAHRYAGGPAPVKPPKYGWARAKHEWQSAGRWILACAIAAGLLQGAVWMVGASGDVSSLREWQVRMGIVTVICLIIAASYTLFPKKEPAEAVVVERPGALTER